MTDKSPIETSVLYNADCPVCSYEIDHYAAYSGKNSLPIRFDDLNDPEGLQKWRIDPETAARRLHVLKDGKVYDGVPAFIKLWEELPRYRGLAKFAGMPGVYQTACAVYDYVLAPLLYRSHLRRLSRSKS